MTKDLTIVMYHYVREIKKSAYPKIKGLEFSSFKQQLDFLEKEYNIISANQLIAFLLGYEHTLPKNSCLLTFDDGYKDHINFVFSELRRRKISGCFFPPVRPIIDKILLDVNAIHYILACIEDIQSLVSELLLECSYYGISENTLNELWKKNARSSDYDTKEVVFVKKALQRDLPEKIRSLIITKLFEKYVNKSKEDFCSQLYMSLKDIQILVNEKMYIGNHTYSHYWLNSIDKGMQKVEIEKSLNFLASVGAPTKNWIMCYPYGAYNSDTLNILRKKDCIVGLTTKSGVASLSPSKLLELKRFDTNYFL